MKRWILPSAVLLIAALVMLLGLNPPKDEHETVLRRVGRLPIKHDGRVKPLDTLARTLLRRLSGTQSVKGESGRIEAMQWLLDDLAKCDESIKVPLFRIDNIDVLTSLGLESRKGFRYSWNELLPYTGRIDLILRVARQKDVGQVDLYDRQIMALGDKVYRYQAVQDAFELDPVRSNYPQPLIIPPEVGEERWATLPTGRLRGDPYAARFSELLLAWKTGDMATCSAMLDEIDSYLTQRLASRTDKLAFESLFNHISPFFKSAILYLFVFLLSLAGWASRRQGLLHAALIFMWASFVPHTFAIIARMFLSGYPPVTNLYSTAIFVGWSAVLAAAMLEGRFRERIEGVGSLVGGATGFVTLLIAHYLAGSGDTIEPMRAVLDTRFWLTIHVITIMLGYVGMLLGGFVGIFFILNGFFTRRLSKASARSLDQMLYSVICFGLFFSFSGTVLGGLWADDSWGRFWGWDPKENGALVVVIWLSIQMHARIGRMLGPRGLAVTAVLGNIVLAWSWFGVNQLGIGLHSYGFTENAVRWLVMFVCSQLLLAALGCLPLRWWRSELPSPTK